MAEAFDPYQTWLGIPPAEQPPDHYRLLGVRRFEKDPRAIQAAAEGQLEQLRLHQHEESGEACERLIAEVTAARACLLNENRRAAYDRRLLQHLAESAADAEKLQAVSAETFLDLLEWRELVEPKLIADMRRQLSQSKREIPAATIARRLVEKQWLTRAQAKRLLSGGGEEPLDKPSAKAKGPRPTLPDDDLELAPLDDELGLAPLEEDEVRTKPTGPPAATKPTSRLSAKEESAAGAAGKPATGAKPSPGAAQPEQPTPAKTAPSHDRAAGATQPTSLLDEELPDLQGGVGPAGPLDGLMADGALDTAAGSALAPVQPKKKGLRALLFRKGRKTAGRKENVWDSPLLLVGGGTLLVLLILGTVLTWALTRQSGDEALQLAEDAYRSGSYTQAIHRYTRYLEQFPGHSGVAFGRVRRGLAQLRQAIPKGNTRWPAALETADAVLAEIATVGEEFKQAQGELASLLPEIAEGLAAQARENPSKDLVEKTEHALALIDKYVPPSLRPGTKLSDINASLSLTVREIRCDEELEKAVAAMLQAAEEGSPDKLRQAYAVRDELLKQYPRLAGDEKLKQAVLAVSRAQRKSVRFVEQGVAVAAGQSAGEILAAVTLTQPTVPGNARGVDGHVVCVAADGAAYGLDAASGQVLWRRFVGFSHNGRSPAFPPTPISSEPGADVLLLSPAAGELERVDARTGQPRWRQRLAETGADGDRFDAHPVMAGSRVLVAARSGRLMFVDLESGELVGYVETPQSLRVAPLVDGRREIIFQVAEHTNLFVLGLPDGRCRQVVYLGHARGSIHVPPVLVSRYLLLVENNFAEDSTLRVLSIETAAAEAAAEAEAEAEGLALIPRQQIRLAGHVDTVPLVAGHRVLLATDAGSVHMFDVGGGDPERPARELAKHKVSAERDVIRYPAMQGGRFWIADTQLTAFNFLATQGRIVPQWVKHEGSTFLEPPRPAGQTVYCVRREAGLPGALVEAVSMEGGDTQWETRLATPLLCEPIVDPTQGKTTAVTAAGAVFEIDVAGLTGPTVQRQPTAAVDPDVLRFGFTDLIRFGGGALAIAGGAGSERVAVFNPAAEPQQFRWITVPGPLGCAPIAFGGGLLVPSQVGQVYLLDPRSGRPRCEPFQPPLQPGVPMDWRLPASYGPREVLLCDGRENLYRVTMKPQPRPHLAAVAQAAVAVPIVSPLAVVGEVVYAVDRQQTLTAFKLPELKASTQWSLSGRPVWGPRRVGDHVLLSTDDDQLLCLDGAGTLRWQVALGYGPLAGAPWAIGDEYVLASTEGAVWRVAAADGTEAGRLQSGRPLASGPVSYGNGLLVAGHDGTVYQIRQP